MAKKTKLTTRIKKALTNNLAIIVVLLSVLVCGLFIVGGNRNSDGSITLDGSSPDIKDYTKKVVEDFDSAIYRIMNESPATDESTISANAMGLGGYSTTLEQVKARRLPDGDNDGGRGWQCSKYAAYLATGKKDYSEAHPDYGPVHGKDMANYLVNYFGWKYTSEPVEGAIGSGGFNTLYGHTAMFLYWTGNNTAMVNDANFVPLTVDTHNMNVSGWVWVVPGDYNEDAPTPEPSPAPTPVAPVSKSCDRWTLSRGDTLGKIMLACEGRLEYGAAMQEYAKQWVDEQTGVVVFDGWRSYYGIGLYEGHTIVKRK